MKRILLPFAVLLLLGQGCAPAAPATTSGSTPVPRTAPVPQPIPNPTPAVNTPTSLEFPGMLPEDQTTTNVRIKTNKGDIVVQLLPKEGPRAASNFVYLIGKNFYDGLTFHRVEPGFVIQGGDPDGNGTGGPGYRFQDDPVSLSYDRGIVAMANAGPNTNGSQFFIMLADTPLPPNYSIFGKVIQGMDVVDQIRVGDVMQAVTLEPLK